MQCKVFAFDCQGTLCQSTSAQPIESTEELIGEQGSERDRAKLCAVATGAQRVQLACRTHSPPETHHMLSLASIDFLPCPDVRCMISRSDKVSLAGLWGTLRLSDFACVLLMSCGSGKTYIIEARLRLFVVALTIRLAACRNKFSCNGAQEYYFITLHFGTSQ